MIHVPYLKNIGLGIDKLLGGGVHMQIQKCDLTSLQLFVENTENRLNMFSGNQHVRVWSVFNGLEDQGISPQGPGPPLPEKV
jgi:hypothetical protein